MPLPCSILPPSFPFPIARSDPGPQSGRKARRSTMGSRILRLVCISLLASVFPGASGHDTVKQQMRFAAEAAQQGLWREAAFRWERILKEAPENAKVHNNLGVAYESLGQFERARKEYEEAKRLAPDSKEIRGNYAAFLELCKQVKECAPEPEATHGSEATPGPDAVPASPSPPPVGEESPQPTPPAGPPSGA